MAEQNDYALTHTPPNNAELMLLCEFIDNQLAENLTRHKYRMFDLLEANGLIARSVSEQRFISRYLSIYAETKVFVGKIGKDGKLDTNSLEIGYGKLNDKHCAGILCRASDDVVLRGPTRDTKTAAMESFIDLVLLKSREWKAMVTIQRDDHLAGRNV